ncbi:tRNA pseudouridine(55) synthase TruB [Piscirickettsia litoralis]|uniref:tRNA pseudouridine synthase B n=1 Tax=Piscirickettsia litoralis TaxID=1891921 RepID=A0ABX3A1Z9_9GAMM|nr:tRNA pseudouridine(55) synthase TruB [Piscirickettsia litoralis]ODN42887.1 tRNA pseudouridine(55) synthase TruB [Piscirickettsia litoralis]
MARRRKGRKLDGVLLLDKPTGLSSNHALQRVKRFYQAQKAGHTGTLDPLATGMLPICFGEATKFSRFLLDTDKCYQTIAKLGERTDTLDSEGEITERLPVTVTRADIEGVLPSFRGEISQVPPMYSALKKDGKPLYKLARQGVEIERVARDVTIHSLELLNVAENSMNIELAAHCSKGTYIRSLVDDIGQALGCGAHVSELRRTRVAHFSDNQLVSLQVIESLAKQNDLTALDGYVLPIEAMLTDLPELRLTPEMAYYMRTGRSVSLNTQQAIGAYVCVFDEKAHQFIGVAEVVAENELKPVRILSTDINNN